MKTIIKSVKNVMLKYPLIAFLDIIGKLIYNSNIFIFAYLNKLLINEMVILFQLKNNFWSVIRIVVIILLLNIIIGVIKLIFNYVRSNQVMRYGDRLTFKLIQRAYKLKYGFFDDAGNQNRFAQYLKDSASEIKVYDLFMSAFFELISFLVTIIICIDFDYIISIFTLIVSLPIFFFHKKMKEDSYQFEKTLNLTNRKISYFKNIFFSKNSYLELHLFRLCDFFMQKLDENISFKDDETIKFRRRNTIKELVILFILSIANFTVNIYLIIIVVNNNMLLGDYTYYSTIVGNLKSTVDKLANTISELDLNKEKYKNYLNFNNDLSIDMNLKGNKEMGGFDEICFKNVGFIYPNTQNYVVRNLSFTIKSHEKIAFSGVNGVGKTTILLLLMRFYEPTEGEILIDGTNINELDLDIYRDSFSAMFQNSALYNISLRENITFDNENIAYDDMILQYLNVSLGYNYFENSMLSDQISKYFDSDGLIPSEGIKQRINLAKTICKHFDILIMDEPFVNIDAIAKERLFSDVLSETDGKTLIMVSHNIDFLKHMDMIFFIVDGSVLESGSHEELMERKGAYYNHFQKKQYRF